MEHQLIQLLQNQIRGVMGALFVLGLTFSYTMETWWLGWTLPYWHLLTYTILGLVFIVLLTRYIGFKTQDTFGNPLSLRGMAIDFAQIVLQSLFASYVSLLLIGIIEIGDPFSLIVRLGLIEMVPLGFGAALANALFAGQSEEHDSLEGTFPRNIGVFAVGAVFITGTVAPTQEMELISAHMNWFRHVLLGIFSLIVVYLVLYELEFKGQAGRSKSDWEFEIGTTFMAYTVGLVVSAFLLVAFGHFRDTTLPVMIQETLVLAFPASLGAAAAEVVI